MLKLSKQQYNMYKADCQMYSRLDISYWLRQQPDSQTLLPYLQQTAKTNSGSHTARQQHTFANEILAHEQAKFCINRT